MAEGQVHIDSQALVAALIRSDSPAVAALALAGQDIVNEARRQCPVDTGRLRQSITSQLVTSGDGVTLIVGTDVEYAAAVHNGHREITPVNARVLAFTVGGVRVFARRVRATQGVPFLARAVRAVLPWANVPDKL